MGNSIEKYIELFMDETGIQKVSNMKEEIIQKSGKATMSTLFGLLCISSIYIGNTSDFDTLSDTWVDGQFDGSIDFIYFDYDLRIVYIGQAKYTKINNSDCLRFIDNMIYSVNSIKEEKYTSIDGNKIRLEIIDLVNKALDGQFNFEYVVFAKELINDQNNLKEEIKRKNANSSDYKVSAYYGENLLDLIIKSKIELKVIKQWEFNYDGRNSLRLFSSELDGYIINLSAWELIQLYIKNKGNLFKYNVREFISKNSGVSGIVNKGLRETVQETPERFWFANNGIIIIAEDVIFNLNNIRINDFSIINGAQTISNLYKFFLEAKQEKEKLQKVFIVTKIIKNFNNDRNINNLIIRASNTQKPVSAWTFFSSDKMAIKMKTDLEKFGLILNIKEGDQEDNKKNKNLKREQKWKYIDFANYVQKSKSFFGFLPGLAIQSKNKLFKNDNFFDLFINVKDLVGCLSYIYLSDCILIELQKTNQELFKNIKPVKFWIISILSILLLKKSSYNKLWNKIQHMNNLEQLTMKNFYDNFKESNLIKDMYWIESKDIQDLEKKIHFFVNEKNLIKIIENLEKFSKEYKTKDSFRDENYYLFLLSQKSIIDSIRESMNF